MNKTRVAERLQADEDFRAHAYQDTEGVWTIGYGLNLQEWTISQELAERFLFDGIRTAEVDARLLFPTFDELTDARQEVLVNMAYNLGRSRLGKFVNTRRAIAEADWQWAAEEMLDSKWAKQVKGRALRLAEIMRAG